MYLDDCPLVSILTTVKNGENSIANTIKSVQQQSYKNIEYIIVDAYSTDNTVSIVNSMSDGNLKLFVEKDDGVYHGMNNAISKASGDIIAILNCGDSLYDDGVLGTIVDHYNKSDNKDLVINGGIRLIDEYGNAFRNVVRNPDILKYKYLIMPVNHPAFFVSRSLYEKYGVFDTSFKIAADYELVLRLAKRKVKFVFIEKVCTNVAPLGLSSYANNIKPVLDECYAIRSLYIDPITNKCLYLFQSLLFGASKVKKYFLSIIK